MPEAFAGRKITGRAFAIIEVVGRYRFITSSDIVSLTGGNEDVTYRHLQQLYHQDLVSRLQLPTAPNSQFVYYLENTPALRELVDSGKVRAEAIDFEQIRQNRAKYRPDQRHGTTTIGQVFFLEHELMISHFRASLEQATIRVEDRVALDAWRQGPTTWHNVSTPPNRAEVAAGAHTLPVRPDAYFTLRFLHAPSGQQFSRFFFEADRNTTSGTRFRLKLLAYLYFFLTGAYAKEFRARKVRAVLVETTSQARMEQLRRIAGELAATQPLAAPLFWFTTSGLIREKGISSAVWQTAFDARFRALLD